MSSHWHLCESSHLQRIQGMWRRWQPSSPMFQVLLFCKCEPCEGLQQCWRFNGLCNPLGASLTAFCTQLST